VGVADLQRDRRPGRSSERAATVRPLLIAANVGCFDRPRS
jgi:hypothetical protein